AGGHEAGALLVGRDDQLDLVVGAVALALVVAEDGVVGGQNRAAAVAEYGIHALVRQDLYDHVGAAHGFSGQRVLVRFLLGHLRFRGSRVGELRNRMISPAFTTVQANGSLSFRPFRSAARPS